MMTGGWNIDIQGDLPPSAKAAFEEATTPMFGATYGGPFIYVGSQIVAGTNYMLLCKQTLVLAEPVSCIVKMEIFDPLPVEKANGAKATITSVTRVAP